MKHWLKSYKDRTQAQLKEAKDKIACFYKDNALGPLFNIQLDRLRAYESTYHTILEKEEQTWRQKSRVVSIKEGDNNTKCFHQFADFCKNMNTIWEIRAVDGSMVCSFKDKV
jgi:hypothetical protein